MGSVPNTTQNLLLQHWEAGSTRIRISRSLSTIQFKAGLGHENLAPKGGMEGERVDKADTGSPCNNSITRDTEEMGVHEFRGSSAS